MIVRRVLSYPATLMTVLISGYVLLNVQPGSRLTMFAMLTMTAVGATELWLAVARFRAHTPTDHRVVWAHALAGIGGLLVGFALLDSLKVIPMVAGCLAFAAAPVVGRGAGSAEA